VAAKAKGRNVEARSVASLRRCYALIGIRVVYNTDVVANRERRGC